MKKSVFRQWMVVAILILAISILAACSSDNNDPEPQNNGENGGTEKPSETGNDGENEPPAEEGPFELSIVTELGTPEPPKENSEFEKKLEEATNTKLDIEFLPGNYGEVINARTAGGDLAQAVFFRDTASRIVMDGARAGMFWEIGPYLKDYPYFLSRINEDLLKSQKIDGKTYVLPRTRNYNRQGYVIRKDWLDNLGLDMPETIDDLTEILVAFSEDDPDGNGKDDTVGLSYGRAAHYYTVMIYGGNTYFQFNEETGKMESRYSKKDPFVKSLNWHKYLFENDYLNRDMFELEGVKGKDKILRGEAGFLWKAIDSLPSLIDEMADVNPDAELDIGNLIVGPEGQKQLVAGGGTNGGYLFPKSEIETEEELRRVLQFFDDISGPAGSNLLEYGLEGVHHTVVDGVPTMTEEQEAVYDAEVDTFGELKVGDDKYENKGEVTPIMEKVDRLRQEAEQHLVFMDHFGLQSATMEDKGNGVKMMNDADALYISGQITLEEWEAKLETYWEEYGNQILDELTAAYKERYDIK